MDIAERLDDIVEYPVEIPTGLLAAMLNAIAGWVAFLGKHPVQVISAEADEMLTALGSDTALAIRAYDQLAAAGVVPSRAEISAIYASAGTPAAPVQLEVPRQKIWTPEDRS